MSDTPIRREIKTYQVDRSEGLGRFVEANNIIKGISSIETARNLVLGLAETMILIRQTGQRS